MRPFWRAAHSQDARRQQLPWPMSNWAHTWPRIALRYNIIAHWTVVKPSFDPNGRLTMKTSALKSWFSALLAKKRSQRTSRANIIASENLNKRCLAWRHRWKKCMKWWSLLNQSAKSWKNKCLKCQWMRIKLLNHLNLDLSRHLHLDLRPCSKCLWWEYQCKITHGKRNQRP